MEIINHNIEKEKRLVELFGYYLSGPDGSNRWTIWDSDKKNEVYGYIQYKKLHGGQKSKGIPKVFGYHTLINSPNVKSAFSREVNSEENSTYKFEIKGEDGDNSVHITMGECPSIQIWSSKYGHIDFSINYELRLRLGSKTENFNVCEVFIFGNIDDLEHRFPKKYIYHIEYCKKKHELSDSNPKWRTTREISGEYDNEHLKLNIRTWLHGRKITDDKYIVPGTIEEMAINHGMGIDTLNHFRYILNRIIPTKEDALSAIVGERIIRERGLSVLFDSGEYDIEDDTHKKKVKSSQM